VRRQALRRRSSPREGDGVSGRASDGVSGRASGPADVEGGGGADRPRRGRPRRYPDPHGGSEWLNELSPTAQHIITVARRLLIDEGFDAVTIENVALEAHTAPATVRRLFTSKAGLLHAVWDRLQIEPWEALVGRVEPVAAGAERLDAYVRGLGDLIADPLIAIGLAELAAHGFRDPIVREKLAADYELARRSTLEVTGLLAGPVSEGHPDDEAAAGRADRLDTMASLIVAVIDGLSLQVAVDPTVDRDAVFALLADLLRVLLERSGDRRR
jgi:AcrR family transcriptional regulator